MYLYLTKITEKSTILNLLFSLLIFSFIAGNLVVNLIFTFIILVSFFSLEKRFFQINWILLIKL